MTPKATLFEFTSYVFEPENKRILFNYKTEFEGKEPILFTETITLPAVPNVEKIPQQVVDKLLESLHLILGISYYKFYVAKKVKLPYELSKSEADFWNVVYRKGLGEFFYKNNLDPKVSPKFPASHATPRPAQNAPRSTLRASQKCLVGIGGGKDSIVVLELLKQHGFAADAFYVNNKQDQGLVKEVINISGAKNLDVKRELDPKVFTPHQYNGHVPVSAIYAFLGLLSAVFYDYSYVIVGNEHSSNFGNITYKGLEVNHQWSKSFEFEHLFGDYVKNSITPDVVYFSLLRSFYEIRIVKLFANYQQYFPYFSSCNNNFKIQVKSHQGLWCGQCAKCVFVFTLLSAFLSKKELVAMFGRNLYQDEALLPLFKDILGLGTMKPFDCVGTFQEAQTALYMATKKFAGDYIVRQIGKKAKYHKEVFATNKENSIPEQFKFLGMQNALIVGFGKEGKVTREYLKKEYPKLKIGIADAKQGTGYLKKQADFDIAIKTPGIKKALMVIPYTTATNIFFSKIKGKNMIIGITGSKGKSTTSTFVYEILKESGKKVKLLGNIGTPMLQDLLKPVDKETIFVLEISNAQLDDIHFSPDIAVVTNLFPEHMDYHGSLANYYEAKRNIIRFQNKEEYFVYNPKNTLILGWLKEYIGKAIPFVENIPLNDNEIPLIGEHNKSNIKAAIAATKLLGVSDEVIKTAIKNFKGLTHRLEFVGEFKGIKFYDDAISTTPDSTIMAIKALSRLPGNRGSAMAQSSGPNIGTIFLGGQERGYDFTQLEKVIRKHQIKNVVLFPDNGPDMLQSKKGLNILNTSSMKEAVQFAYKHSPKGSICLLSCASPSYSLWKNFEQKGDQFKKFVRALGK